MSYQSNQNSPGKEMVLIFYIVRIQFLIAVKRITIPFHFPITLQIKMIESILLIAILTHLQDYRNFCYRFSQRIEALCR